MGKPKGKYIHPDKKLSKKLREKSRGKRRDAIFEHNSDTMRDFLRGQR